MRILIIITLFLCAVVAQGQVKYEVKKRPPRQFNEVVSKIPGPWDLGWTTVSEPLPTSTSAVNSWPLVNINHCSPKKIVIKDFPSVNENICYVWDGYKFIILYVRISRGENVRWNPMYLNCSEIPEIKDKNGN